MNLTPRSGSLEFARQTNDEPQIRLDEFIPGFLVALLNPSRQPTLRCGVQRCRIGDIQKSLIQQVALYASDCHILASLADHLI